MATNASTAAKKPAAKKTTAKSTAVKKATATKPAAKSAAATKKAATKSTTAKKGSAAKNTANKKAAAVKSSVSKNADAAAKKVKGALQEAGDTMKTALDKTKKGLAEFGSNVADQAKGLRDLAELNMHKKKLRNDTDGLYRMLGKKAYEKGNLRGELAELSRKISDKKAEYAKLEIEVKAVKDARKAKK